MSENNIKDFDTEENPFAGVPAFDPTLGWGDDEVYQLALSAKDISELGGRPDISADDWYNASYHFQSEKKYEKAALCLAKAVELGDVLAKFDLAQCYEEGKGVEQDYIKAAELYMAVANCGQFIVSRDYYPQGWAEYAIGSFYERGLLPDSTMEKAIEWYRRAQNDGSNEANWKMVECYILGKGVEQNFDAAAEIIYNSAHYRSNGHDVRSFTFAKALDGKTKTHQFEIYEILAECYLNGVGTDRDEEKALEYQKKADILMAEREAEASICCKDNLEIADMEDEMCVLDPFELGEMSFYLALDNDVPMANTFARDLWALDHKWARFFREVARDYYRKPEEHIKPNADGSVHNWTGMDHLFHIYLLGWYHAGDDFFDEADKVYVRAHKDFNKAIDLLPVRFQNCDVDEVAEKLYWDYRHVESDESPDYEQFTKVLQEAERLVPGVLDKLYDEGVIPRFE